jgi:pimeloyl-ACP methyl ester carboxylesterase
VTAQFRISCIIALAAAAPLDAARAQLPAPTRVRVNDLEMAYRTMGAGESLLLLHGFGGCGMAWTPLAERLAAHYRLIIPDLRGHGGTTNPRAVFTHRQAAEDVVALLDTLKLGRVRAMGISTGGMTLLHVATARPDLIEAMVLIGATHYFPQEARAIMRAVGGGAMPPDVRQQQMECATRGEAQVRQLQEQFAAFQHSYDDMNFTAPYLSTIKARTLIVHGDRDMFFPVHIPVEMYRAIPASRLWIVPGGGHVPIVGPHEQHFLDLSLEFLRGPARQR